MRSTRRSMRVLMVLKIEKRVQRILS